ncbi:MAG: hypothetical protein ACKVRO_08665 [Micropepsaceae bacterium]
MANTIRIPVPDVAYARVSLPKIDIEDNPYESLANAAAGIGDALKERKARDDAERLSKFRAAAHKAVADHLNESVRNGTAGPGLTLSADRVLDEEYEKSKPDDAKLRAEMDRIRQSLRLPALDMALRMEANARASGAVKIAGATMEELAQLAYLQPDQIGAVRDEARMLRDHLGDQGLEVDGQEQKINEAYLRGLMASNPKLALETLRSRKGGADEDLGISEPLREALEHEAERATQAEQDSDAVEQQNAQIGHRLETYASLAAADASGTFQHAIYAGVRDAYRIDPASGRDLEAKTDAARERATVRAKRHGATGHALVKGIAIDWDANHLESLDAFIDAVADDASGAAIAGRRRIRMAAIAGTTPPKLQAHIRDSLHASDPARRAGSVRMLQALDAADDSGKLTSWLPPDLRAFAHRFTALSDAGYADATSLKNLDAANSLTPATTAARRHHFDAHVRLEHLAAALGRQFNVDPTGIAVKG